MSERKPSEVFAYNVNSNELAVEQYLAHDLEKKNETGLLTTQLRAVRQNKHNASTILLHRHRTVANFNVGDRIARQIVNNIYKLSLLFCQRFLLKHCCSIT